MRHAAGSLRRAGLMAGLFSALHPLAGVWERGLISRLRPSNPVCSVTCERSVPAARPAGLHVDPLALAAALWFRCGMG